MDADALVRDYLGRLEEAASGLPAERRTELAAEVREHIESALAEARSRDEVAIRNVLERLGSPGEIVAAESAGDATGPPLDPFGGHATVSLPAARAWGAIEIIALLLLTVGAIALPFVGPLFGLVFVWLSGRWTRKEKLIATVIVVALLALPIALFFGTSTSAGLNGPQVVPQATAGPVTHAP